MIISAVNKSFGVFLLGRCVCDADMVQPQSVEKRPAGTSGSGKVSAAKKPSRKSPGFGCITHSLPDWSRTAMDVGQAAVCVF
ncbi:hypothetical protein NPIL_56941 [Nephila pilipes]|uniref:Uncharacterized protein n=1 Tax=Nephila pilipes TaxID=299642 RepID=A0A8X6MYA8_NEPPI|nr:hypothetical protein NPIL_56941 [Nephila pilipes]